MTLAHFHRCFVRTQRRFRNEVFDEGTSCSMPLIASASANSSLRAVGEQPKMPANSRANWVGCSYPRANAIWAICSVVVRTRTMATRITAARHQWAACRPVCRVNRWLRYARDRPACRASSDGESLRSAWASSSKMAFNLAWPGGGAIKAWAISSATVWRVRNTSSAGLTAPRRSSAAQRGKA